MDKKKGNVRQNITKDRSSPLTQSDNEGHHGRKGTEAHSLQDTGRRTSPHQRRLLLGHSEKVNPAATRLLKSRDSVTPAPHGGEEDDSDEETETESDGERDRMSTTDSQFSSPEKARTDIVDAPAHSARKRFLFSSAVAPTAYNTEESTRDDSDGALQIDSSAFPSFEFLRSIHDNKRKKLEVSAIYKNLDSFDKANVPSSSQSVSDVKILSKTGSQTTGEKSEPSLIQENAWNKAGQRNVSNSFSTSEDSDTALSEIYQSTPKSPSKRSKKFQSKLKGFSPIVKKCRKFTNSISDESEFHTKKRVLSSKHDVAVLRVGEKNTPQLKNIGPTFKSDFRYTPWKTGFLPRSTRGVSVSFDEINKNRDFGSELSSDYVKSKKGVLSLRSSTPSVNENAKKLLKDCSGVAGSDIEDDRCDGSDAVQSVLAFQHLNKSKVAKRYALKNLDTPFRTDSNIQSVGDVEISSRNISQTTRKKSDLSLRLGYFSQKANQRKDSKSFSTSEDSNTAQSVIYQSTPKSPSKRSKKFQSKLKGISPMVKSSREFVSSSIDTPKPFSETSYADEAVGEKETPLAKNIKSTFKSNMKCTPWPNRFLARRSFLSDSYQTLIETDKSRDFGGEMLSNNERDHVAARSGISSRCSNALGEDVNESFPVAGGGDLGGGGTPPCSGGGSVVSTRTLPSQIGNEIETGNKSTEHQLESAGSVKDTSTDKPCRRSKRNRVRPLEYWRGERQIIKILPGKGKVVMGIDPGRKEDDGCKRSIWKRIEYRNEKKMENTTKELYPTKVFDANSQTSIQTYLHRPYNCNRWTEVRSRSDPKVLYKITKSFAFEGVAFGFLDINPEERKEKQQSMDYTLHFVVLKGLVKVLINEENPFRFKMYDSFLVPRGQSYSIENVGKTKALLSFGHCKNTFFPNKSTAD